jgi:hypothetical protein
MYSAGMFICIMQESIYIYVYTYIHTYIEPETDVSKSLNKLEHV